MIEIEYGERIIQNRDPHYLIYQHLARYEFAKQYCQGNFLLDVACGNGYGTELLAENGGKVIGLDYCYSCIHHVKKTLKTTDFFVGDAVAIPFKDNLFDIVISFETIEHLNDFRKFLSECRRVLKPKGLFICSTPNKRVFSPFRKKPINKFHKREFYPEEFYNIVKEFFEIKSYLGQGEANIIFYRIKNNINIWIKTINYGIFNGRLNQILTYFTRNNKFDNISMPYKNFEKFQQSMFVTPEFLIIIGHKS